MRFTIITPCLNREKFIAEAIESVLAQRYHDIEHWIIDGGSTDKTLEIVRSYPHLRVLSEPDRGVYDAFNKGLDRATGDAVIFLNSDDLLTPGTLALAQQIFQNAFRNADCFGRVRDFPPDRCRQRNQNALLR